MWCTIWSLFLFAIATVTRLVSVSSFTCLIAAAALCHHLLSTSSPNQVMETQKLTKNVLENYQEALLICLNKAALTIIVLLQFIGSEMAALMFRTLHGQPSQCVLLKHHSSTCSHWSSGQKLWFPQSTYANVLPDILWSCVVFTSALLGQTKLQKPSWFKCSLSSYYYFYFLTNCTDKRHQTW